ncbi:MAG: glycosyltransferase family 2 protein [Acidobacteriota bacterium]|nr:glycosyltransferase family 2 protein [Acidobacteriota bacterium]
MRQLSVFLFLFLAALIAYIVAGYPLLLAWMARRSPSPTRKGGAPKSISVIIAVHNGEAFLADKLLSILDSGYPAELMEILVVSDGSSDNTEEIAKRFASRGAVLLHVPRGGKPRALNAAIPQARGEILVLTDVRQVLEPQSLNRLVECFEDPSVGVVSGDLIIRDGVTSGEKNVGMYWRYERAIRKNLGGLDSMFGATGPFYAMRRDLAVPIPEDSLLDDMYLPLAAFFRGYRLIVEERARAFDYPTGIQTEFGRKVRTLAGNYQILGHYPALLTPRNRMLFHYLSYKIARLALPWIVVLIGLVSFSLPSPWNFAALIPQAGFYLLAAVDGAIPAGSKLKRIASLARTVVTLLTASILALRIFFVAPRDLWKPTQISK